MSLFTAIGIPWGSFAHETFLKLTSNEECTWFCNVKQEMAKEQSKQKTEGEKNKTEC